MATVVSAAGQTPVRLPPASLVSSKDKVVWVNTRSGVYHYLGERYFGSKKVGKFIREKSAKIGGGPGDPERVVMQIRTQTT